MLHLLLLGLFALSRTGNTADTEDKCGKIVCYHSNWSQYRPGSGKFFPDNIDPTLCTHLIYAFAKLTGNHLEAFEWNDDSTDWSVGLYEKFQALKQRNPAVKTLLAVGGWNMGSEPFTHIVQSPSNRQAFVAQSIKFLRDRGFDGLDLDWEYPANRGSPPEDKGYFTELVRELRKEFERESIATGQPRLLLTAAVAAGKDTIDTAYDIPAISQDLDFINLMSYDLHGAWETVTGHNSPLYARSDETGDDRNLNMDFAAQYWVQQGAPREKLIVGMGLYGRSFTLASPDNHGVGAPAPKGGIAGTYTRESGFLSYYEVCDMKKAGGQVGFIDEQRVPYIHHGDQWVGYDSTDSLREKVRYVKKNKFGGVMVWALPLDDFSGTHCGEGPFPLMHAINDECQHLTGVLHTPAPAQTTQQPPSTTAPPPGVTQAPTTHSPPIHGDLLDCMEYPDGFYPSHRSCQEYFVCVGGATFTVECEGGLIYNPDTAHCDWPENYHCTIGDSPETHQPTTTDQPTAAATYKASTMQPTTTTTDAPTTHHGRTTTPVFSKLTTTPPMPTTTTSTPKPTTATPKPTTATPKPTTTTPKPTTATPKPTTATPKPTTATPKPTTATPKPTTTTPKPTTATPKPTTATPKPTTTTPKPTTATPKPTTTTEQPTTPQPTTVKPTTAAPVVTTSAALDLHSFCWDKKDGIYPDPTDCTYFMDCSNGYAYRMACAPGSVFNPAISTCDNAYNVPHCHGHPHVDAVAQQMTEAASVTTTTPKPTKIDVDSFCHDKFDGLYPDPHDCAYFIQCSNHFAYHIACAPGTAFHPVKHYCDNLANVPSCDHRVYV